MVFNSLTFVVFFAIVLVTYGLLRSWTAKKVLLLVASYIFYGAWNPPFVLLLVVSTLIDWWVANRLAVTDDPRRRRWLLAASLAVNLGLLGFFKYGEFMLENFVALMRAAGIDYTPAVPDIILPVGISFYTFQTLSYTLDVYRRSLAARRSLLDFSLFVAFFPQLVAGPIVRAADFIPQLDHDRRIRASALGWGLFFMLELEDRFNPRAATWDRLLRESGTPGVHFQDYPELQRFECPEWSHLGAEDSVEFSRRLVQVMRREGLL